MQTVVFVLGMHRSGTSLLASILGALGVPLSDDLIAGDRNNAKGYFESKTIVETHNALLQSIGSHSAKSTVISPLPANWWKLPAVQPYKERLKDLAAAELSRSGGVWGFKDPRTVRLLPVWKEIVAELGVRPRYIFAVRHPREVARSLMVRDQLSSVHAELLWLDHCADALMHLGKDISAVIGYDRWFSDPLEQGRYLVRGLDTGLTPSDERLSAILAETISPSLKHQSASENCELPFSRDLYEALSARDLDRAAMIANLFEIAKAFSTQVLRAEHGALSAQIRELSLRVQNLRSGA